MYEDHTPIWRSARRDEDYPWRVHIRQDVILEDADWIPAKELAYRLDYVRKWPPETGRLRPGSHPRLPRNDFAILEDELSRSARRRRSSAPRHWAPSSGSTNFIFKTSAGSALSRLARFPSHVRHRARHHAPHPRRIGPIHNISSGGLHTITWCGASSCSSESDTSGSSNKAPDRAGSPARPAFAYGVAAALTLDEFALWLNLEDVYWTGPGRVSIRRRRDLRVPAVRRHLGRALPARAHGAIWSAANRSSSDVTNTPSVVLVYQWAQTLG